MSTPQETKAPEPTFVQAKPYKVDLEPGKHREAGLFKPKKITVDEAKTYYLCGCKYTHNEQGFCDGTHRKEEGIKKYNEFLLKANSKLKTEYQHVLDAQNELQAQLHASQRKQKIANVIAGLSAALVVVGLAMKYKK
ncbi:uncharacterized protein B0P05DRAFT_473677 [Gilbertella persicaria]|uniref:uncharacterized protein n=1 Tax=Gilbertella persicaria TaxID=101096 RepID=UPI00221E4B82|nr:uncharacterized protein B0P05DRAFT_473677 [Gilbertella persicaria]KAI8072185.1 hypothetical protein B0P05DRAFT_473677 [Gilbertella persicaria]